MFSKWCRFSNNRLRCSNNRLRFSNNHLRCLNNRRSFSNNHLCCLNNRRRYLGKYLHFLGYIHQLSVAGIVRSRDVTDRMGIPVHPTRLNETKKIPGENVSPGIWILTLKISFQLPCNHQFFKLSESAIAHDGNLINAARQLRNVYFY